MPEAVGVIETLGFPAVLAAADAMVKGGRVTLVYFDIAEKGNFYIAIRGSVSEVEPAMTAGLEAATTTFGGQVMSHYIVPNPPENIVSVLPIEYTDAVQEFRL
ncbi:MAG: carbon dioxide-concentrating mechanism protein CcmK [Chloroflexaceae bacterium]|nr:carbon dioxide-concentrating mechanism protein CcmK [Chloroflexaceae bacterium]